jgi:hypothetical protein
MPELFENNQIPEAIKQFVIAKLDVGFPSDKGLSIGSQGMFSKQELIEHVEKGDDIGKTMVRVQYEFLESIKSGKLLREINTASK